MRENYKELSIIAENLASLYDDGLSMDLSFELLSDLNLSKSYKNSLMRIKEKIIKGYSLADGFREYSKLYPAFFIGIVSLGENSGELSKCLISLGKFFYEIDKVKGTVRGELRYPLFIFISFMLLSISSFFIIIPNIYETFNSISKEVPEVIQISYDLSRWILMNSITSIIGFISWSIVILLVGRYFKSRLGKEWSDILLRIKFVREYYEYIFISLLSVILSSGIQLTKGIRLCIDSTDIRVIKKMLSNINDEILKGNELSKVVGESYFISKYTYSMMVLGERSGDLSSVLEKAQRRLENSITEKLKKIISVISPVSIGFIALLILVFIIIFIIPMMDMIYSGYV